MKESEPPPAAGQLVAEILQKIAELNRQLPPVAGPSLLTSAAQLTPGPEPSSGLAGSGPVPRDGDGSSPQDSQCGDEPSPPRLAGTDHFQNLDLNRVHEPQRSADLRHGAILSANAPGPRPALQSVLEELGLLPVYVRRILYHLHTAHGESRPGSPEEELPRLRTLLRRWWRPCPSSERPALTESHVFIGPAGVGKTTVLCKWLAQAVLLGGRSAYVWRLDGRTANTAEALAVYAEILGVPVARAWSGEAQPVDVQFFDLPGVDGSEPAAMAGLRERLQGLGMPQVHLVLNAAYETSLLLDQVRTFSACPITDLIFTHLDEETRWGKLWNFVAGTPLPIRFLSAGQNVPGHFREATADLLLPESGG